MRLTGKIKGKRKEIIYAGDLGNAAAGTGDIARAWAFNKVYHLINKMTLQGANDADKRQINSLSRKYGIQTPYAVED